ncbi:hypothetical protein AYX15_00287 [Cryptococcus neoformans]|nr:hypothetical protein AYX15_00287 [Cryptococcus neoformans var. grubii]
MPSSSSFPPTPFHPGIHFPRCMYIATLRFHSSTCRTATFPSSFSSFPSPRMFSKSSKHNVDESPDRLFFPNIFPFLHTTRSPPP